MNDEVDESNPVDEKVVKEARAMGWAPLEEFKGNPEHWVDAEEYVQRGEQLMPLLKATNNRLKRDLLQRDEKIGTLESKLENMETALQKLEGHYTAANRQAVETAKAQLRAEMKQAREDGDIDRELDLRERLDDTTRQQRELEELDNKTKEKKSESTQPVESPFKAEIEDWTAENPWFSKDRNKTKQFNRIAEDLREELQESGDELFGRAFLDKAMELWSERHGQGDDKRNEEKVESGRRGSGGGGTGKGFASLPADAKRACMDDADSFVGEGKMFKTVSEWQTYYAKIYSTQ